MTHHQHGLGRQRSTRSKALAFMRRAFQALEARGASGTSLILILIIGATGIFQVLPNGLLVFGLLAIVFHEFQKRLDQGLPLMQLAGLLGILQWIIGPYLCYATGYQMDRYIMYVKEPDYFSFAIPGTAAFVLGLLAIGSSVRQKELMFGVPRQSFLAIGIVLNVGALVAGIAAERMPGGLSFLFHLLSQAGYIGTIYFLFSHSPYRWLLIGLSVLPLVRTSTESAMFHDMILWLALLFCYWYSLRRHSPTGKIILISVVCISLFTIQAIKQEYRAKVWQGEEASFVEHVFDFWTKEKSASDEGVMANVVARLNQGWIISAVLNNVPSAVPFANGETFVDAFYGAFVPRFLAPDKVKAGGQVNFRRFTGLNIADSTSMAISPLGEAYANFGRMGGVITIGGLGMLMSLLYSLCLRFSLKHATFLFWIPLIFYQAIKAETESATVLNQLSKGAVVAFGLHWLITHHLVPHFFPPQVRRKRNVVRVDGGVDRSAGLELSDSISVGDIKASPTPVEGK